MEKPSWASGLEQKGLYFEGLVAEADRVVEKHNLETVTSYGTRTSRSVVEDESRTASSTSSQSGVPSGSEHEHKTPRLFLTKSEGGHSISFNNTPFSVEKEKVLDCQYGKHYFTKRKGKNVQLRLQGTKKVHVGCQAKIKIKSYTLYPEYTMDKLTSLSLRQRKQLQQEHLDKLRTDMADGKTVLTEKRCFVSLPTEEAHSGHPTGHFGGFSQRIHPLVVEQITELVSAGITNTAEVKKILRHYVNNTLSKQLAVHAVSHNRALYPTDIDIRNHIATAKKALELSKLDQENLRLKIERWRELNPDSSFYFRPLVKTNDSPSPPGEPDLKPDSDTSVTQASAAAQGMFRGNALDEQTPCIAGSSSDYEQTFLFVHQEKWQRDLLRKYGGTIGMIDATYKTTRYDLALFFICVRTNVGYSVVGEFIVQSEASEYILEALEILKSWNEGWNPKFFMTDYSQAEQQALESAFPGIKVFLCDFHREQAWERWVRDSKHGLTKDEGQSLLGLLRDCATASPASTPEDPPDCHYQKALDILKKSALWRKHQTVRQWLGDKWLCIPEKWARAYRDNEYHCAVDTNNGVEAQNKLLKYSYLPHRKNITLSSLVSHLVESFLPDRYQKYLLLNFQMTGAYRSYNKIVPEYLQSRPRSIIIHCLNRMRKGNRLCGADIEKCSEGKFTVTSSSGKKYDVDFGIETGTPKCSCEDWTRFHIPCKHFFGIFKHHNDWSWDSLPEAYLQSPHLSCDTDALTSLMSPTLAPTNPEENPIDSPDYGAVHSPSVPQEVADSEHTAGNDDEYTTPLPHKERHCSAKTLQQKISITTKLIESLAYATDETDKLKQLSEQLVSLEKQFRQSLPNSEGLVLRSTSACERSRRVKQKYSKLMNRAKRYSSLPSINKRGRKRQDWRHRNRVGVKADRLRKEATHKDTPQLKPLTETEPAPVTEVPQTARKEATHKDTPQLKPLTETEPAPGTEVPQTAGKKRKRCRECEGCSRDDCGVCKFCLDKAKFGGPNRKKQCCVKRRCLQAINEPAQKNTLLDVTPSSSTKEPDCTRELATQGRKRYGILGDGNCLFRALSHIIYGTQQVHQKMRLLLVDFVTKNPFLFHRFVKSGTITEHIECMKHLRRWGTSMELQAAATLFQRELYLFTRRSEESSYEWMVYKPQSHASIEYPDEEFPRSLSMISHIELCHTGNCHFDCVLTDENLFSFAFPSQRGGISYHTPVL